MSAGQMVLYCFFAKSNYPSYLCSWRRGGDPWVRMDPRVEASISYGPYSSYNFLKILSKERREASDCKFG